MAITKIKVANFKGFRDLEINFGAFNILIGANAAGKSNVIQIFQFMKDFVVHGLDNAISMQSGGEYFRNLSLGASRDFVLEVTGDTPIAAQVFTEDMGLAEFDVHEFIYKLSIQFDEKGENVRSVHEQLTLMGVLRFREHRAAARSKVSRVQNTKEPLPGTMIVTHSGYEVKARLLGADSKEIKLDPSYGRLGEPQEQDYAPPPGTLLRSVFPLVPIFMRPEPDEYFRDIGIFDFDPRLPKRAVQIAGKVDLEGDGSNLAIVLKNILESEEQSRKFANLIRDVLPFVRDLRIERFADKSLFFELRENYHEQRYLPASLLSDGTINVTALIIALYFEHNVMTIIEEPERNIHPALIARVVNMMKDVAQQRQIIVSTHNPEIVKYADLDNLLLVARDQEGFSTVVKPSERETVQRFLESDLGIEDLYVRNLLAL